MRRAFLALAAAALVLGGADTQIARAFIPQAERIADAVTDANRAGSRTQALKVELTLRVADREPIGAGELITHPTGLARLELRDAGERVERHLLVGTEHTASRSGEPLDSPRSFLPPLFLLQAGSPEVLRQALTDYGLDPDAVALAPCGKRICYVVGDRSRVAPPKGAPPDPAAELSAPSEGLVMETKTGGAFAEEADGADEPEVGATLWIDSETFEVRRLLSRDGVVVDLGPFVSFEGVRFPDAVTIREPNREPVRFDILAVTPVNAPAAGFRRAWLLVQPEDGEPPSSPAVQRRTAD